MDLAPVKSFLLKFISNGNSATTETSILGHRSSFLPLVNSVPIVECLLIGSLLIVLAAVLMSGESGGRYRRLAIVLSLSYLVTFVGLYLLPGLKSTEPHQWVIATPFHYLAFAIVFGGEWPKRATAEHKFLFAMGCWLALALVAARLPALFDVERSIMLGKASRAYDRSLTRMGRLAASEADDAVFIATSWGVANQIFVLSDGRHDLVHELYWNYTGPEKLSKILDDSQKDTAYAVSLNTDQGMWADTWRHVEEDFSHLPHWKEVPAGDEWTSLAAIRVRKFTRVP
jgi:hypothetical protein